MELQVLNHTWQHNNGWTWLTVLLSALLAIWCLPFLTREGEGVDDDDQASDGNGSSGFCYPELVALLWHWMFAQAWTCYVMNAQRLRYHTVMRGVVPVPKSLVGRLMAIGIVLYGTLSVLLRRCGRRTPIDQLIQEPIAPTWPAEPPDPEEDEHYVTPFSRESEDVTLPDVKEHDVDVTQTDISPVLSAVPSKTLTDPVELADKPAISSIKNSCAEISAQFSQSTQISRAKRRANKRLWQKKLKRLAMLCAFAGAIPTVALGTDKELSSNLQAYVGAKGILKTTHLPSEALEQLRSNLAELPKELLGGVDSLTAIMDSGASEISTGTMSDFIKGTYKAYKQPKHMYCVWPSNHWRRNCALRDSGHERQYSSY